MIKSVIKTIVCLKNASRVNKTFTFVPYNAVILNLLNILYNEGLIQSFSVEKIDFHFNFKVYLKYSCGGVSVLSSIRIVSTPSTSKHIKFTQLAQVSQGLFFVVLATDKLLLSLQDCKKRKIGGTVLFSCI